MKRLLFSSSLLLSLLLYGTAFGADIAGTYTNSSGEITIANIGSDQYSVTVFTDDGTGRPDGHGEFTGTGKIEDGILTVTNREQVRDKEWINGKLVEKSTFTTVSGTLKIYLKPHSDFHQVSPFDNEELWKKLGSMKDSQIAIIEEPDVTGGDGPSRAEFFRQGIADFSGIYTRK